MLVARAALAWSTTHDTVRRAAGGAPPKRSCRVGCIVVLASPPSKSAVPSGPTRQQNLICGTVASVVARGMERRPNVEAIVTARGPPRKPLDLKLPDFHFPAVLQLPNAKAAAGKLPQQPGQGSLSARASQPPDEWHNFRQRLDLRRSVPLRAVAGNVRSDVVLPRLTNGPPPAPVIPMPHQRMELPFLEGVRRGRRQPDGLAAVFDYNFSCEQPHARPKPRATRLAPSYEPDEHIFNADEAYAIACRGVAQARRQARKIDNEFISLLVHSEAVRITEHRISQM